MQQKTVVVLGAGVSGLTTALLLSRNRKYNITIVAKHMPGDYDIEYASPWAGADYMPAGPVSSYQGKLELETWPELERLARDKPQAGIQFQNLIKYRRNKDVNTDSGKQFGELMKDDNAFGKMLPNFRILPKSELPENMDAAISFTSVCINTALYLPWLASQCLKAGVIIRRGIAGHVSEAADLHHSGHSADLVVNCTGLSSLKLGGVKDSTLTPSRGQTAIVRNQPGVIISCTGTDDGPDESTYIMDRAAGGGCVLGGCSMRNNWDSQPDPNLAVRIMKRAVEICPSLVPPGKGIEALSVIRHAVGLRPMRAGGIRTEKESIEGPNGRPIAVVHNYGHGGAGYQTSYGAAKRAIVLVEEVLQTQTRL